MAVPIAFSAVMCVLLLYSMVAVTQGREEECTYPVDTVPYITFMGIRLPNHSFVDLRQLGNAPNGSNVLLCYTNLDTCCARNTGEWVLPNGQLAREFGRGYKLREHDQQIDLAYDVNNADERMPLGGIYRCDLPITNAINSAGRLVRESVYVGLYARDALSFNEVFITPNSDLNGDSPQFTITCVSVGGPAGCVVWRRQKEIIPNPNTTSALINPAEGRYVHNLTVSGRYGGAYSCSVANNKPASEYDGIYVEFAENPLFVTAVQESPTSIRVIWVTNNPPKKTIGFRIYYRGGSTGFIDIDDPLVNSHVLTGLKNNASYVISIASRSNHLPSERLETGPIHLVPGEPELRLYSATPDSISFSWTLPPGSLVDGYEVKWDRNHTQFATFREPLSSKAQNYTVTGLRDYDNATFTITVTAFNAVGIATSANMNIAANFASGTADMPTVTGSSERPVATESSQSSDNEINEALIAGIVVGGAVILAIAVVVVLVIYCYKLKSDKKSNESLYSLAGPMPPPRPDIQTHRNRSYNTSSALTNRLQDDAQQQSGTYYTPMSYTYPTTGPILQQAGSTNIEVADGGELTQSGHGYDYITVQK